MDWADFLGTGRDRNYLSYEEAKKVLQKLKCKNISDFKRLRPKNISASPDRYYKNKGWISWGDFLGNGNIATAKIKFPTYEEAKKIICELNIKNQYMYNNYRPKNLPASPNRTYKNRGWVDWFDFLGKNNYA